MAPDMRKVSPDYWPLIKQHMPKGFKLKFKKLRGGILAYAHFVREIVVEQVLDAKELFIFLHEAGHVHLRHVYEEVPENWREEYEADQYAIKAMRAAGVPVPRECVKWHKEIVRDMIEKSKEHVDDEAVLKYAYGKEWRKHR
jgi:predicted sulfurtransferase